MAAFNKPKPKQTEEQKSRYFQFGSIRFPSQIVNYGYPGDVDKKNTSAYVAVYDEATTAHIRMMEQDLASKFEGELKSCIKATGQGPHLNASIIAVKFTKDESKLEMGMPDFEGIHLNSLGLGALFVGDAGGCAWGRNGSMGLTIYINRVLYCGKQDDADIVLPKKAVLGGGGSGGADAPKRQWT
jgi:hypothetical protein